MIENIKQASLKYNGDNEEAYRLALRSELMDRASKKEVLKDLSGCIRQVDKDKLALSLKHYGVHIGSREKKESLVDKLIELLNKTSLVLPHLYIIDDRSMDIFKQALSTYFIHVDDTESALVLNNLGLCYIYSVNGSIILVVPDDIKKIYLPLLDKEFDNMRKQSILVDRFIDAAINLYGAISLDHAYELLLYYEPELKNSHTKAKIFDSFYNVCNISDRKLINEYYICSPFFYHENKQDYLECILYKDIPFYKPVRDKFYLYSDFDYVEIDKSYINLHSYLSKMRKITADAHDILYELEYEAEFGTLESTYQVLEEHGVLIESQSEFDKYHDLYMDFYNSRRLWINRGNTIKELELIKHIKTQKVGRNEPCPCGSGKKYKKCCL